MIDKITWTNATPEEIKKFFEEDLEKKEEPKTEEEINSHVPPYARGGCI